MKFTPARFSLVSLCAITLALGGCASQSADRADRMKQVDASLMKAAEQATSGEITQEKLNLLEQVYKRNPDKPEAAIRYGRALAEVGKREKAIIVLRPFAYDDGSSPFLKNEYARLQLESGNYEEAEKIARAAMEQDQSRGQSYQILGVALDAQGHHKQAEAAFRYALDKWTGDPVPVMNNLALSLTAQGYLDEAAEILRKAKKSDPSRREIERNLRIVNALRETEVYKSPLRGRASNPPPLPAEKPQT